MTENRLNHKLDTTKLKTIKDVRNVFDTMELVASFSEDNELYEVAKEYFTIPYEHPELLGFNIPRQTLEEIEQELDEKIDKQVEDVEYKFAQLKYYQEYQFSKKITKIIEDIEYAKEHGQFPPELDYSKLTATGGSNFTSSLVIKQGNKHEGYYTIGNGYLRFYMPYKPNAITRWFMDKCVSIRWVDEKND